MATTKKDLINRIAEGAGCTHVHVKAVVQKFFNEIISELAKGNHLEFRDFGVFETRTTPARIAEYPKTLEKVPLPARCRAAFKPGKLMREGSNSPIRAKSGALDRRE